MFRRRVKCAVLVDFDNIAQIVGAPFGESAQSWLDWFEDARFDPGGPRRRIVRKMVYWNTHNEKRWRPCFEAVGFEAFNCPSLVKSKKSEADMRIALDAQRIAYEEKSIEEFAILSTDTDFVALLNSLADLERRTIAAANKANSSYEVYKKHADITIPVQDLKIACDYRRPLPLWKRVLFFWRRPDARYRRRERTEPLLSGEGRPSGVAERLKRLGLWRRDRKRHYETPEEAAGRPPGEGKGSPELERAADIIVDIARDTPGLPVARRTLIRRLSSEMPAFRVRGARPFLGCGEYRDFLKAIAKLRASLRVHFYSNGGAAVSYHD